MDPRLNERHHRKVALHLEIPLSSREFFRYQPERRAEERRVPVALLRPAVVVDRRDLAAEIDAAY
jgi:hypothetical protein